MTIIAVVICGVRYRLEQHHLAAVAQQEQLAAVAEQQRLATIAEQKRLAALVEQQRLAVVAEQQRLAAAAQQEHLAAVAQEQRKQEDEAAAQKAIQKTAEQHAQYVARYVYPGFTRKPGNKTFAVAVASENETLDSAVTAALISRFKNEPVEIVPSFFKAAFVSDGLFQVAFNGSGGPFEKLDLTNSLDAVVFAQQNVQYSQNAGVENVVSATMQMKVVVLPVSRQADSKGWTFTAYGPGFTKEIARQAVEERLIEQIAADTNMSLGPINSTH
jgi:hypothetical protein